MWEVVMMTLATSSLDSLNPMAIIQQFVLQGLVKKPRDIWYFILPTGVINFLGGVLFYFGLAGAFSRLWALLVPYLSWLQWTLGGLCSVALLFYLYKSRNGQPQKPTEKPAAKIKGSLSPLTLILLGGGATLSELATAFPYFAFLGLLMQQKLAPLTALLLMLLYNFIYMLPLMVMYVIYIKRRASFDAFYQWLQRQMIRWQRVLIPLLLGVAAVYLFWQAGW